MTKKKKQKTKKQKKQNRHVQHGPAGGVQQPRPDPVAELHALLPETAAVVAPLVRQVGLAAGAVGAALLRANERAAQQTATDADAEVTTTRLSDR